MIMTSVQKQVKKKLTDGETITGEMIAALIEDHLATKTRTLNLYERYKAVTVPIYDRTFEGDTKINNKINNDFFSEIIDIKQGYLIGKPIVYSIDKNKYESGIVDETSTNSPTITPLVPLKPFESYQQHIDFLSRFTIRCNTVDLDSELVKLVSICGHAGREIHIDVDGEVRIANLNPWETIFLTNTYGEVEYALRYFLEMNEADEEVYSVEFFDSEKVSYFVQEGDAYNALEEQSHLFGACPIIKVTNNAEELGDVERVLNLIDGYDRTISDVSSEIEQFRLAYMYFKGKEPTPEMIESAKQTGGFYVGEDGEVGFITKNINDSVVENHLNRLEDNIMRFSKSVHFGDKANARGQLSGVALKYQIFALESKAVVLETKLQAALRNQFKIIANVLNLGSQPLDYLDIFFEFTRNIPINMQDEISANGGLVGLVSERTRLAQLPFVDDVDYEIEQMKQDKSVEVDGMYDDMEIPDDEEATGEVIG